MFKKLAGYTFVSLLSFCVFSLFLNTAANAKGSGSDMFASVLGKSTTKAASPTPPPPIAVMINPTKPPSDPSPTEEDTPTPSPTTAPTATPTSAPTATPTSAPTDTPTPTPTNTPTPTPTTQPTGTQPTGSQLDAWFTQYANESPNIDRELLRNIARCESGFNTNSDTNPPYVGMYQFDPTTWSSTRASMGLDTNPDLRKNAEEAIKTAAYKIRNGGASAWPTPTCP